MLSLILNLLKPATDVVVDVVKKRVLNHYTPKGILLLVLSGLALGKIDNETAQFIIKTTEGLEFSLKDGFVFGTIGLLAYLIYKGIKLVVKSSEEAINSIHQPFLRLFANLIYLIVAIYVIYVIITKIT